MNFYTYDANAAKPFGSRQEAEMAAVSIRWTRDDVFEYRGKWYLADKIRLLTERGFASLLTDIKDEFRGLGR